MINHLKTCFLFLFLALNAGCPFFEEIPFGKTPFDVEKLPRPAFKAGQGLFSDCKELQSFLDERVQFYNQVSADFNSGPPSDVAIPISQSTAEMSTRYSQITQDSSIQESDYVKTLGKQVYVGRSEDLLVYNIGEEKPLQIVQLPHAQKRELLVYKNLVAVISEICANAYCAEPETQVSIYKQRDTGELSLAKESHQAGRQVGSRILGNTLINVTARAGLLNNWQPSIIERAKDSHYLGVQCNRVQKPSVADLDLGFSSIFQIDLDHLELEENALGLLGSFDISYFTTSSIYLVKNGLQWFWFDNRSFLAREQSFIQKIELDQKLSVGAQASILGKPKDQWSLKEFALDKTLVVAASTTDERGIWNSSIYSLKDLGKSELVVIDKIENFSPNENIRAVRIFDDHAYVVTFQQTDPLFVFDIKRREDMKQLGHLTAPGFSTFLLPVADNRLFGIGFDVQTNWGTNVGGVQMSLIDVSNPLRPEMLKQIAYGDQGSYSDATFDHRALYVEKQGGLLLAPLILFGSDPAHFLQSTLRDSGIFRVNLLNLEIQRVISHRNLLSPQCLIKLAIQRWWSTQEISLEANRLIQSQGNNYFVSRVGMTRWNKDLQDLSSERPILFPDEPFLCRSDIINFPQ